jgi:hypothetical protein
MENQERNNNNKIGGYLFVGFMFIGMGIGMALHNTGIGTLVGIGFGFIAAAVYKSEKNK